MRRLAPMPINHAYLKGRRLMLSAVIMFALVHVCGFRPTEQPYNLPIAWTSITEFIPQWVWVCAWGVVIAVAVVELFTNKGRKAISGTVGLCYATAAAYLASYVTTVITDGWGSREWFYFGIYLFAGLMINGLLIKVGALKQEAPSDA